MKTIKLGSPSTHVISLNVLHRIVSYDLNVVIDKMFKEYITVPPPHIVDKSFSKNDVKDYIESGMFDVSWYITRGLKSKDEVLQVLSLEERSLKSFKMCNLHDLAHEMKNDMESLLAHFNLANIEQL